MTTSDIILSILTSTISSVMLATILKYQDKKRWEKTRLLYVSKISGERALVNFDILTILDIDIMMDHYNDEPKDVEEIKKEIQELEISDKKYRQLAFSFQNTIERIEMYRSQALVIPTFSPVDFHKIDESLKPIKSYLFSSGFFLPIENDKEDAALHTVLKEKISAIYS